MAHGFIYKPPGTLAAEAQALLGGMAVQAEAMLRGCGLCDSCAAGAALADIANHAAERLLVLWGGHAATGAGAAAAQPPVTAAGPNTDGTFITALGIEGVWAATGAVASSAAVNSSADLAVRRLAHSLAKRMLVFLAHAWEAPSNNVRSSPRGPQLPCAGDAVQAAVEAVLLPEVLSGPAASSISAHVEQALHACARSASPASVAGGSAGASSGGAPPSQPPLAQPWKSASAADVSRAVHWLLTTQHPSLLQAGPTVSALAPQQAASLCGRLHLALQLHGSCVLAGPPGCGKSSVWTCLAAAWRLLDPSAAPQLCAVCASEWAAPAPTAVGAEPEVQLAAEMHFGSGYMKALGACCLSSRPASSSGGGGGDGSGNQQCLLVIQGPLHQGSQLAQRLQEGMLPASMLGRHAATSVGIAGAIWDTCSPCDGPLHGWLAAAPVVYVTQPLHQLGAAVQHALAAALPLQPAAAPAAAGVVQAMLEAYAAHCCSRLAADQAACASSSSSQRAQLAGAISAVAGNLWRRSSRGLRLHQPVALITRACIAAATWLLLGQCSSSHEAQGLEVALAQAVEHAGQGEHLPPAGSLLGHRLSLRNGGWVAWSEDIHVVAAAAAHAKQQALPGIAAAAATAAACPTVSMQPLEGLTLPASWYCATPAQQPRLFIASERTLALQCVVHTWLHAGLSPLVAAASGSGADTALRHLVSCLSMQPGFPQHVDPSLQLRQLHLSPCAAAAPGGIWPQVQQLLVSRRQQGLWHPPHYCPATADTAASQSMVLFLDSMGSRPQGGGTLARALAGLPLTSSSQPHW